jgi:hypothetical protein
LRLQVENEGMRRENQRQGRVLDAFRRLTAAVGAVLVLLLAGLVLAVGVGILQLRAVVPDTNNLLVYVGVVVVITVAIGGYLGKGRK